MGFVTKNIKEIIPDFGVLLFFWNVLNIEENNFEEDQFIACICICILGWSGFLKKHV
jgi:hypothetical protein